jgi:hypothetical protein
VPASGRNRWLDRWRALLVLAALWLFPSVCSRIGGDGCEYYVLLRSPVLDGHLDFANDFNGLGCRAVTTESGEITSRVLAGVAAISMFAVLVMWLGTPLYFYTVANPFMSHAVAILATTLFFLAWLRARHGEERSAWMLVGTAGGLMSIVGAPSAALLVLPLVSLLWRKGDRVRLALAFGTPVLLTGLFQVCVWRSLHGADFVSRMSTMNLIGQSMPHVLEMLLPPRHGLFIWTPLYVVAVGGWAAWVRRDVGLTGFLIGGFAAATVVNSCFADWWGSDSFGQRRLLPLPLS